MIQVTKHATIADAESVPFVRLLALRVMLRLELHGMKRRGQSAYSIVKQEFGLKGNKQSVFDQFSCLVEAKGANVRRVTVI